MEAQKELELAQYYNSTAKANRTAHTELRVQAAQDALLKPTQ